MDKGILLLVLGGVLLLTNLDNGRLWQDEAETAVLARNTLRFGYPRAFDGVNRINPGLPVREGYAWTYHSWLPFYLAAGSFRLLGENTLSARLPFALLGWGAVGLSYLLAKRLFQDILIARLSTLLLVTSVPFLLHMRQCRYYAPAVFFTLWSTEAYWRFLHGRRWGMLGLAAALTLLFHADHGAFLPVLIGLGLHFLWSRPDPLLRRRGAAVAAAVLVFTVPWMIYLQAGQHHRTFLWEEVRHHLEFYFRQVNRFLFPIVFWALAWRLFRFSPRVLFGPPGSASRSAWKLVGLLLGSGFLFLIFLPEQRHFRYLIFLVPFLFFVQATFLACLWRSRRAVGLAAAGILLFTDLIHYSGTSLLAAQIPATRARLSTPKVQVRSLILEFFTELTQPYRGPIDGVVELLQAEGKPGQVVKTPYEEHPLIFYTQLTVEPVVKPEDFLKETFPDWIVLRRDWLPSHFFESAYYQRIQARYQPVLLDAPDIPWQNRPDPGYHRFQTDRQASPVLVFRRQP